MFVVRCSLFVVCCLSIYFYLVVACWLLFVVCFLLFGVWCARVLWLVRGVDVRRLALFVVRCSLFVVRCSLFVVCCLPISFYLVVACWLWFVVCFLLFGVWFARVLWLVRGVDVRRLVLVVRCSSCVAVCCLLRFVLCVASMLIDFFV